MQNKINGKCMLFIILIGFVGLAHSADKTGLKPSREVIAYKAFAGIPGHKFTASRVIIPPGSVTPSHRHDAFVFVYVLEGSVRSQLDNGKIVEYQAGQSWMEPLGVLHSYARNASETETATVLAMYVSKDDAELMIIEKHPD